MTWRFEKRGKHTFVEVFENGLNCGELCFWAEEFNALTHGVMAVGLEPDEVGIIVKIEEKKRRQG